MPTKNKPQNPNRVLRDYLYLRGIRGDVLACWLYLSIYAKKKRKKKP